MESTRELIAFLRLTSILKDLDDIQICIDSMRAGDPDDQGLQLDLDRRQTVADERRRKVEHALSKVISFN